MSFRGDEQRRYGHIPPVQYPVAGQHRASDQVQYMARRPSFNSGDDAALYDPNGTRQSCPPTVNTNVGGYRHEDDLFMASPGTDSVTAAVMAGYQQSPTSTSTYNPQAFARSQSQNIPHHPHAASNRYGSQTTSPYSPTQANNYAPAPYNPAAYAEPAAPPRQTYAGYGSYNNQGYASPPMNQAPYWQPQPTYATSPPPSNTQPATSPTAYTTYDQTLSYSARSPPVPEQTSYQTYAQMPVGPNYSASDPNDFINRPVRSGSRASPLPSPPPHAHPSSSGLRRHPTNAPLPSRPAEAEPINSWEPDGTYGEDDVVEHVTQESIMQDIEAELGRGTGSQRNRPLPFDQRNGVVPEDDLHGLRRLNSATSYNSTASTVDNQEDASGVNRYSSNASTLNRNHTQNAHAPFPEDDDDESDPEAAAGLLAMAQADEEEHRRLSSGSALPYFSQPEVAAQTSLPNVAEEPGSDSDYAAMDLGLVGGGYAGHVVYDNNINPPLGADSTDHGGLRSRMNHPSQRSHGSGQLPAFSQANTDYGGTGGLLPPSTHRLSFDQGEERVSLHSRQSGSESPSKDDYPDMFYHPGMSNRPLPAVPAASDSASMASAQSSNQAGHRDRYTLAADPRPYTGPDAYYGQNAQQLMLERSISLSSQSTSPQVHPPARSRTDAEARRLLHMRQQQQQSLANQGIPYQSYDAVPSSSIDYDVITLPSGRRKKFAPEKFTIMDTRSCTEPWALSGISNWVREMADGEPDLKLKAVEEGIVRLFCLKVPTMNTADAEVLGARVVSLMLEAGILIPDEEWLKFGPGTITGVLWQLTGSGCYAPKLHETDHVASEHETPYRCYSHHCGRTLKKAYLGENFLEGVEKKTRDDWLCYWKLTAEDLASKTPKEIAYQHSQHEILTKEEDFVYQMDVLRMYRDGILQSEPRIIAEGRIDKFVKSVFGKADAIQEVNKEYLLAPMKYRQKEQGPFMSGVSDIFREWIRKAKQLYLEYAAGYVYAEYLMKREMERNYLFSQFLDEVRRHPKSERNDWTSFLKLPITRIQRYNITLDAMARKLKADSEEKANLVKAMAEIKAVTMEMNVKVGEAEKKVKMIKLNQSLVLRPGFHADLNLDSFGRELITEGELQRMGSKGVRWVDTHALLFDHYLILAKLVTNKDVASEPKYDVSKEPIPMPLLFLESSQDEPISRQKGITAPLTRAANSSTDVRPIKATPTPNGAERPGVEHASTTGSGHAPWSALTNLHDDGKILYPFRVKHLGHEVYTLFAPTPQVREHWCTKIIEAKTRHAKALHAQNAEPFRLRVLADSAFAYDSVSGYGKYVTGVHIRGTPLDRALRDTDKTFGPGRGPPAIIRSAVHCATGFTAYGRNLIAVGTDAGICVAEVNDQRGWTKTVTLSRVTQIAVLEEFSVMVVLSDRTLISYPLDTVAPPPGYMPHNPDSIRRAPVKLAKDVNFFATSRMKERMLLFYKWKDGLSSKFKVLEPVLQRATERRGRIFGGRKVHGTTESFRDYDEFYMPVECYSLNLFKEYVVMATSKGFEGMTLDKKNPMSVPDLRDTDLKDTATANIGNRIKDQRPLGMFKLNDQEHILAYEDCAVYVDKHAAVSRSVIMEYSGKQRKARGATMYGQYLLLFNEDYVEVRNAENGRLRQIIAGRDVRVLDYGYRGATGRPIDMLNGFATPTSSDESESKATVKICMAHPEVPMQQILLELRLNNGHTET